MDTWKSALAFTFAGVMLAGTALAQSGGSGTTGTSGTTKGSGTVSGSAGAGTSTGSTGTSGSASGSATTGTKSDMKKSGDMKSSTDMKSKSSGKMSGGADQVKAVQKALKDKGMDPGEIDGKMGPKTQSALRAYQKKEGLKENGRLDTETMAKLGVAKTSDSGSTTPSASPSTGSSSGAGSSPGAGSSSTVPSKQTR